MNVTSCQKGSKWWKVDFHTHTPASCDFGRGSVAEKTITPTDWLQSAMEAHLDAVVVTDHNSGGWVDKLKDVYNSLLNEPQRKSWFKELVIFPGVEITIDSGKERIHLLAIFDPSCGTDKIHGVLGACGITDNYGDDKSTASKKSFSDVCSSVTEHGGIAIPAHVDKEKGLLNGVTTLTPTIKDSLGMVCAAQFVDCESVKSSSVDFSKAVDRLAKVKGSEAHRSVEIGSSFSWIKMSTASIRGLELALTEAEYCVRNQDDDPNVVPDLFVESLVIEQMKQCGRGDGNKFEICFNPHFNSLIGGRGTGKSTILESIRIGMRRDKDFPADDSDSRTRFEQFARIPQSKDDSGMLLEESCIQVGFHRRGVDYILRWAQDGSAPTLLEKGIDGNFVSVSAGRDVSLHERFPVRIYSQKQINELSDGPRGLLEIIDQSNEVDKSEWQQRWDIKQSEFLQLCERERALATQLKEENAIKAQLSDVERDLRQYEEKGYGEVLRLYQKRMLQESGLLRMDSLYEQAELIRGIIPQIGVADFPEHLFDQEDETVVELRELYAGLSANLEKIASSLSDLANTVESLGSNAKQTINASKWSASYNHCRDAFNKLCGQYQMSNWSSRDLNFYGEWILKRNNLQSRIRQIDCAKREYESVVAQRKDCLRQLRDMREDLFKKRTRFVEEVIGPNPYIQMEIVPFGDVSDIEERYRGFFDIQGGTFAAQILERDTASGVLYPLFACADDSKFEPLVEELKVRTIRIAHEQDLSIHASFVRKMSAQFNTRTNGFDLFQAWWPEDLLRVKYARDLHSGHFENLKNGSAGQKAAAILAFLLSYGTEPLIIDQPEDDLDNALVYDLVVKQIRENKVRRQLIVVTHNPNIVVNGDAELVHVMKFENGQIKIAQSGGLEETGIRDSICTIMEGGAEAFDKRYQRIRER